MAANRGELPRVGLPAHWIMDSKAHDRDAGCAWRCMTSHERMQLCELAGVADFTKQFADLTHAERAGVKSALRGARVAFLRDSIRWGLESIRVD